MNAYEIELIVAKVLIEMGYTLTGDFRLTRLFDDLGMDSLDILNLLSGIEDELDIRSESFSNAYSMVKTLGDVCDQVEKEINRDGMVRMEVMDGALTMSAEHWKMLKEHATIQHMIVANMTKMEVLQELTILTKKTN